MIVENKRKQETIKQNKEKEEIKKKKTPQKSRNYASQQRNLK